MKRIRDAFALVFGPDDCTPVSVLWGLILSAVGFATVAMFLRETDCPSDLSEGEED